MKKILLFILFIIPFVASANVDNTTPVYSTSSIQNNNSSAPNKHPDEYQSSYVKQNRISSTNASQTKDYPSAVTQNMQHANYDQDNYSEDNYSEDNTQQDMTLPQAGDYLPEKEKNSDWFGQGAKSNPWEMPKEKVERAMRASKENQSPPPPQLSLFDKIKNFFITKQGYLTPFQLLTIIFIGIIIYLGTRNKVSIPKLYFIWLAYLTISGFIVLFFLK